MGMPERWVLSLDIGTSSVRAAGYTSAGCPIPNVEDACIHMPNTTAAGGSEFAADELLHRCINSLRVALSKAETLPPPLAVATSCFWHSLVGIAANGLAITPVYTWADTRSAEYVSVLTQRMSATTLHNLTGCFPHTSYLPARLLWLQTEHRHMVEKVTHWLSFPDYLYLRLFGSLATSISMASGSGLFSPFTCGWEPQVCAAACVAPQQLPPTVTAGFTYTGLKSPFKELLPSLASIPWYPAIGDGACSNVGCGSTTTNRIALMVGTSGAMRCVLSNTIAKPPDGLWCYRLDETRMIAGGALSNGGNVLAWLKRSLQLPPPQELENMLATMAPCSHGLTMLPLLAGERSPGWAASASGAIMGLRLHTGPVELVQATMEAICHRFVAVFAQLRQLTTENCTVVATGGALLHSPAWMQMMADALGVSVYASDEKEASCRGAALMALEHLGVVDNIRQFPATFSRKYQSRPEFTTVHQEAAERQMELYRLLV